MALIPYSVSPRFTDHRRGPKPMKNSSTLILNHLAMPKCAASWMTITRKIETTKTTTPTQAAIRRRPWSRSKLRDDLRGPAAGPGVGALHVHQRDDRRGLVLLDHHGDRVGDPCERDLPVEEGH